jgi:hypothetical protein
MIKLSYNNEGGMPVINIKNIAIGEVSAGDYLFENGRLLISKYLSAKRVIEIINRLIYDIE